jgi:hypothetical protein
MNVYFLVEGRRTESRLYPAWIAHLVPHLTRVYAFSDAVANNFYLISADGQPSITGQELVNAVREVEEANSYDYLVVVLDAEELTVAEKIAEVERAIKDAETHEGLFMRSTRLAVVVQHRCIETWLLGNRRIFTRTPQDPDLMDFVSHYNVMNDDPEAMPCHRRFKLHAKFHFEYLRAIFRERGLTYSKSRPGMTADAAYLEELIRRIQDCPRHLASFSRFLELCRNF